MKEVYIIQCHTSYGGYDPMTHIHAIYSNKESANAAAKALNPVVEDEEEDYATYTVERHIVKE